MCTSPGSYEIVSPLGTDISPKREPPTADFFLGGNTQFAISCLSNP